MANLMDTQCSALSAHHAVVEDDLGCAAVDTAEGSVVAYYRQCCSSRTACFTSVDAGGGHKVVDDEKLACARQARLVRRHRLRALRGGFFALDVCTDVMLFLAAFHGCNGDGDSDSEAAQARAASTTTAAYDAQNVCRGPPSTPGGWAPTLPMSALLVCLAFVLVLVSWGTVQNLDTALAVRVGRQWTKRTWAAFGAAGLLLHAFRVPVLLLAAVLLLIGIALECSPQLKGNGVDSQPTETDLSNSGVTAVHVRMLVGELARSTCVRLRLNPHYGNVDGVSAVNHGAFLVRPEIF